MRRKIKKITKKMMRGEKKNIFERVEDRKKEKKREKSAKMEIVMINMIVK